MVLLFLFVTINLSVYLCSCLSHFLYSCFFSLFIVPSISLALSPFFSFVKKLPSMLSSCSHEHKMGLICQVQITQQCQVWGFGLDETSLDRHIHSMCRYLLGGRLPGHLQVATRAIWNFSDRKTVPDYWFRLDKPNLDRHIHHVWGYVLGWPLHQCMDSIFLVLGMEGPNEPTLQ